MLARNQRRKSQAQVRSLVLRVASCKLSLQPSPVVSTSLDGVQRGMCTDTYGCRSYQPPYHFLVSYKRAFKVFGKIECQLQAGTSNEVLCCEINWTRINKWLCFSNWSPTLTG
jgi:hypothetical protein